MVVTTSFWNGKKVCITGHTGFKGAWLSLMLRQLGAKVCGVSLKAEETSLCSILEIEKLVDSKHQDIRNFSSLKEAIDEFSPEILFHLAAQSLVRESYINPVENFTTNVQGTLHVLETIRLNHHIKTAVIVTTDKCYENNNYQKPFRETDALGGHDPYSASKAACEIVSSSYIRSFFSKTSQGVATARSGNVIGGGDFAKDRIIPDLFRSYTSNSKLQIRYPHAVRPWQHVLEPLSGYICLAENLHKNPEQYSDAWNFGPQKELVVSVQRLVEKFSSEWGSPCLQELDQNEHPHESSFLLLNCEKARDQLKWESILSFDDTLKATADWYKKYNSNPSEILSFTIEQINSYLAKRNTHTCNVEDASRNLINPF